MPILKSMTRDEKKTLKLTLDTKLLENVQRYCDWAQIGTLSNFFEQAAEYILKKDPDFKEHETKK